MNHKSINDYFLGFITYHDYSNHSYLLIDHHKVFVSSFTNLKYMDK